MKRPSLAGRRAWVFDLDGTLTVAVHDFDAIRARLGLPPGRPILEELARLPAAEAKPRRAELERIEAELARSARPAPGAAALCAELRRRGLRLGILTRNSAANAALTLAAAGLAGFFPPADRIARDHGPPKPDPAALRRLLSRWRLRPAEAVMVGDFRFDLEAGRAAGCLTVHVDPAGAFPWPELADLKVRGLAELLAALEAG